MGRGRVEMKRIESKINRQVTFSKRKSGLQKKAHEISVLCDAEVVLIIFSARGKMFEYSSNLSMENILERYERYSYAVQEVVETEPDSQGDWSLEHIRLNTRLEALQRNQRHLKGEDLDSLTLKQLQHLEKQLETAMKHIRLRKNQLMYESLSELRIKEKALQKENNMLGTKIKEKESVLSRKQKQQKQNQAQNSSPCLLSETIPSLKIGGTSQEVDEEGAITQTQSNTVIPPWMLRHVNE